jgi:hypothetical protein
LNSEFEQYFWAHRARFFERPVAPRQAWSCSRCECPVALQPFRVPCSSTAGPEQAFRAPCAAAAGPEQPFGHRVGFLLRPGRWAGHVRTGRRVTMRAVVWSSPAVHGVVATATCLLHLRFWQPMLHDPSRGQCPNPKCDCLGKTSKRVLI